MNTPTPFSKTAYSTHGRKQRKHKILIIFLVILLIAIPAIYTIVQASSMSKKKDASPQTTVVASYEGLGITKEEFTARRRFVICLDPGHGYEDPGTDSEYLGDYTEKDITLDISLKLKTMLEKEGFKVVMTRDSDEIPDNLTPNRLGMYTMGATERADIANSSDTDLFLSIHCNSFDDPDVGGTRLYYYPGNNETTEAYAQLLSNGLKNVLGLDCIMCADKIQDSYQICREVNAPTVLAEAGFVTNPNDAANMMDSKWQEKYAESFMEGIINYFHQYSFHITSANKSVD